MNPAHTEIIAAARRTYGVLRHHRCLVESRDGTSLTVKPVPEGLIEDIRRHKAGILAILHLEATARATTYARRLQIGSDMLFEREQKHSTGGRYPEQLGNFINLLCAYEEDCDVITRIDRGQAVMP